MISTRLRIGAVVGAALALLPATATAQLFSPGELSRAHSTLEGLTNCTQCHEAGQGLSQRKCLDCHTELKGRVDQGKGYHGRMKAEERACESCHHEHQGLQFPLIEWEPSKEKFPHDKTGYRLRGKHQQVKCEECHDTRLIVEDAIKEMLRKQPQRKTFLGVGQACKSCHFDQHRGQFEESCDDCHDEKDWKKPPHFDHEDDTDYALTGKHRKVECKECHEPQQDETTPQDAFPAPVSRTFLDYGDQPHGRCIDCHADPHQGKFPQRCESCHSTADWRTVRTPEGSRTFHDKTRYPLKGMHADVACQRCHGPFPGQKARFKGLPFEQCTDCHVDAHHGQLSDRKGRPAGCDGCHTVEGFAPTHFEREDHAKLPFPLEGAHEGAACGLCHPVDATLRGKVPASVKKLLLRRKRKLLFSDVKLDVEAKADQCQTCHTNVHAGQFEGREDPKTCNSCHLPAAFTELKFDHQKDTKFPLEGRHAETACASCHERQRINRQMAVRYRGVAMECSGCHADVHGGQFAVEGKTDCQRCHDSAGFEKTKFVHAPPFTDYLLDGKHTEVKCDACHPAVEVSGAKVHKYRGVPRTCEGCHTDFHEGAFRGFTP